jgi:hypothetical protein
MTEPQNCRLRSLLYEVTYAWHMVEEAVAVGSGSLAQRRTRRSRSSPPRGGRLTAKWLLARTRLASKPHVDVRLVTSSRLTASGADSVARLAVAVKV